MNRLITLLTEESSVFNTKNESSLFLYIAQDREINGNSTARKLVKILMRPQALCANCAIRKANQEINHGMKLKRIKSSLLCHEFRPATVHVNLNFR